MDEISTPATAHEATSKTVFGMLDEWGINRTWMEAVGMAESTYITMRLHLSSNALGVHEMMPPTDNAEHKKENEALFVEFIHDANKERRPDLVCPESVQAYVYTYYQSGGHDKVITVRGADARQHSVSLKELERAIKAELNTAVYKTLMEFHGMPVPAAESQRTK